MRALPFALLLTLVAACSTAHVAASPDASVAPPPDAPAPRADAPHADAPRAPDVPPAAHDAAVAPDAGPPPEPSCAPDAGAPVPTFRTLYARVVATGRCVECHSREGTWGTTLDLSTAEIAYADLVGVPGCTTVDGEPYRLRVSPCHPEDSTLAIIPTGRGEPCGRRHTFELVSSEAAAEIDAWIAAGAAW